MANATAIGRDDLATAVRTLTLSVRPTSFMPTTTYTPTHKTDDKASTGRDHVRARSNAQSSAWQLWRQHADPAIVRSRHMATPTNAHADYEERRSPSPMRIRRHRRSYTISAPLGTRVNAFPNPSGLAPTPPRKNSPAPSSDKENAPPPRCASSNSAPLLSNSNSKGKNKVLESPKRPRIFHTTSIFNDRFLDLPPLPESWTSQHDRAICLLDSRNYSHPAIVSKLRRVFPELRGTLTPLMIDKRLRILDQNVELDYWRINHRAHATLADADRVTRYVNEEIKPTKESKGLRFIDAMLGRKSESRGPAKGLGKGFRSVLAGL